MIDRTAAGWTARGARVRMLWALVAACLLAALAPLVARAQETAETTEPTGDRKPAPLIWGDLYPAKPADVVVKQPDGSSFKARLTNAEIGGHLEHEGFTVSKRDDGWWVFADGYEGGELVLTAARVGLDARPADLVAGSGRTHSIWDDGNGGDIRAAALRQLQVASAQAQAQAATTGEPRVFKFPVLLLATWWDEEAGQSAPQFQPGTDTPEYFRELLDGFGGNPKGTLTEFYFENSFGQFIVQVDVFGPYTSQRSREDRCYYGGIEQPPVFDGDLDPTDSLLGVGGGGAIGMAGEATPQADPEVDFAEYDNDGDGVVDFTGIIHSGPDMAATGDPCHTWSHAIQATLGEAPGAGIPTNDGVVIDRLFTMPEIDLEIGVATHEMAHALGEPDYYNPDYTSMGTGDWDIMAGGSWFGNPPGSNPTGFNPASRVFQGWMTPKIVHDDLRDLTLQPRELLPAPAYTADQENPNIVLVPTKWIKVGEEDETGHVWSENDVYGLVEDGDKGFVIDGYYLENWSRTVNAPPIHPEMTRAPYFDRQALSSGLMVWHFDYFYRSNVYFGQNNAGSDPNRPQMDPVEFDYNDNTQELQLGLTRGEPTDLVWGAATGITSGTRELPPGVPQEAGDPQATIEFTGVTPPASHFDHPFTVEDNEFNYLMTVRATGVGDCTLQLLRVIDGEERPAGPEADSGFVGAEEVVTVITPEPGEWIARVGDFAACGTHEGSVEFSSPDTFISKGAGDTWSAWTEGPTGWAFTNVGPAEHEELDHRADAPGPETITLDVLHLGETETDVSPGFARGAENEVGGLAPVNVGRDNPLSVPVFNNGGTAVTDVAVEVRSGTPDGPVVASGTVPAIAAYDRADFSFTFNPAAEGFWDLYVTVDPAGALAEVHEGNNAQKTTGWAGPADPKVLVVDDDGPTDSEALYAGALASLGIPYAIAYEHVDAETMAGFEAVIWEAGLERYQGQMNPDDRAAVQEYLDGGGKLLYTSPRAAAALGEPPSRTNPLGTEDMPKFLKDYFGVAYLDTVQVGGGLVTGLGDILGDETISTDVFPGRPLQDVFTAAEWTGEEDDVAIGTVTPVADWEKGGEEALMGVRMEGDAAHNGFQSVFLGFNLAQVNRTDDAVQIVGDVMEHFGVAGGRYQVSTPTPVLYHPQVRNRVSGVDTPVKLVALGGGTEGPARLFYGHHGGPLTTVEMVRGDQPGTWEGMIPGPVVTPDGVDYALEIGGTSDPRLAVTGAVLHAIGVALPEVVAPLLDACPPAKVPVTELDDIEGNTHQATIECIAWYGITIGKGDIDGDGKPEYDPAGDVTRAQMASFIVRALEEGGVAVDRAAANAFGDDEGNEHEANINALAALGIVKGRADANDSDGDGDTAEVLYFPNEPVSRPQMASFIARMHEAVTGALPADAPDAFSDDNGNEHEANINALAALGVVEGRRDTGDVDGDGDTTEVLYFTREAVSRAQMASFIARDLELFVEAGKAYQGGADVVLDSTEAAPGDDVSGTIVTHKDLQGVTAEGCGVSGQVEVAEDGTFTVTIPEDREPGSCRLSFTITTARPAAGSSSQVVTHDRYLVVED